MRGAISDYRSWAAQMEPFGRTNRAVAVSLRHYFPERWDGKGSLLLHRVLTRLAGTPTRRRRTLCCAGAASGHAAAPPKSVAKNFRRRDEQDELASERRCSRRRAPAVEEARAGCDTGQPPSVRMDDEGATTSAAPPHSFSHLGCVTAKVAVYAPTRLSREPGSGSSTCCAGAYSPWPPPFAPPTPLRSPPQS
jgi:hypothetical protein